MKVMIPKSKIEISQNPEFVESPVKLSISLLVSNRIGSIRKCMDSLKLLLDAIPSELIAVDTVGEENSDGSLAVVREYTDQIVHFDWTGDFSEARNAGLALAQGEWFLYVDDDEWFEDPSEIIEFFRSGDYLNYGCTQYAVRSYTDENMKDYSEGWVSRMVRRTKEMRFIHRVHEMMFPVYKPEKHFSQCYAHHVGYIFKNDEEREKHFERNINPILEELGENPNNLRLTMQAVQEYIFHEDYEKAEQLCRQGESNTKQSYELVWNWIVATLVQVLMLQNKHEEVLQEGRRILGLPRLNQLARMNIDYAMVGAAQTLQDHDAILEFGRDYEQARQYLEQDPQRVLQFVMLSLSDVLKVEKRKQIQGSLFFTYKNLKRYEELCEYADTLSWDEQDRKEKFYFLFLLEAAVQAERYSSLTAMVKKVCEYGEFPADWMSEVETICNCEDSEKKYCLRKAFAGSGVPEPYFLVLKAWCAEQDERNVTDVLQECLAQNLDCAPPREELLGICLRNSFDPMPFLEPLYMEDWAITFFQLVKHTAKDDLQALLNAAQNTLRPISESQYFVFSKMIREKILDEPAFPEDQLWKVSQDYVYDILGYSRSIYRDELFADSKRNLPRETVFALYLREALQAREQGCLDKTLSSLKECLKAYPPRKNFVTRLIAKIKQELERENQQKQEFASLGEQIKKQIYYLISLGQTVQAQQVLEQLRTLTPNDLELDTILQKIQA